MSIDGIEKKNNLTKQLGKMREKFKRERIYLFCVRNWEYFQERESNSHRVSKRVRIRERERELTREKSWRGNSSIKKNREKIIFSSFTNVYASDIDFLSSLLHSTSKSDKGLPSKFVSCMFKC